MDSTFAQFLGEFIGTFILILLGNGVVCAVTLKKTKAEGTGWVAVAFGWGLAVMLGAYVSSFLSEAHLNPAVTIGMALLGNLSWSLVLPYIIGQFLGAMLASLVLWLFYYPHWEATKDSATILGCYSTAPAIKHTPSNFFGEIIGTMVLMLLILAFGRNHISSGMSPAIVGGLITSIGFSLGATTGYAINPARDLGPRIMHAILPIKNKGNSGWGYAWIPVIGPILGSALGALIFNFMIQFVK
ncbi:MIP/aquaporin family protein [Lactovum odontotermitis]